MKTLSIPPLLVVTSYPPRNHDTSHMSAMAQYGYQMVTSLAKHRQILVAGDMLEGEPPSQKSSRITIERVWKKNDPLSLFRIYTLIRSSRAQEVLFQFEFNVFGTMLSLLSLSLLLFVLRISRVKVTFEMHQVVENMSTLSTHINLHNKIGIAIFNIGLRIFYRYIGIVCQSVIVLEEGLKKVLSRYVPIDKIFVNNHLVLSFAQPVSKAMARTKLGIDQTKKVVLVFGFINWYKGSDLIAHALGGSEYQLILAGGPSTTLSHEDHYKVFYAKVQSIAKKHKNITLTGFVPDDKVSHYFAACDLVVLPYRVFMSASGPFSLALQYQKPVLFSDALRDYSLSADFQGALSHAKLKSADITFGLSKHKIIAAVDRICADRSLYLSCTRFVTQLSRMRSKSVIAQNTLRIIGRFDPTPSPIMTPAYRAEYASL